MLKKKIKLLEIKNGEKYKIIDYYFENCLLYIFGECKT